MTAHTPEDLQRIYGARFCASLGYRKEVWQALVSGWFGQYVPPDAAVLDLWDFWDHYIPLTETSLKEALVTRGFGVDVCIARFLPYTMAAGPRYPIALLRAYLALPVAWRFFGQQFLVVGQRR